MFRSGATTNRGDIMGYRKAYSQIKKLEDNGYLNKGDSSVTHLTHDINIIYRFFNDKMNEDDKKHLKRRLTNFLIDEEVLFGIGYSLVIIPHEPMVKIINNATSYLDMLELDKIPFIDVRDTTDKGIVINFKFGGKRAYFSPETINFALDDGIRASNHDSRYGILITSEKCMGDKSKEKIDKLFE